MFLIITLQITPPVFDEANRIVIMKMVGKLLHNAFETVRFYF